MVYDEAVRESLLSSINGQGRELDTQNAPVHFNSIHLLHF